MKKELIFNDKKRCYDDYELLPNVYFADIEDEIENVVIGNKELFITFDVRVKDDDYDLDFDWHNVIVTDYDCNTIFDMKSKISKMSKVDEDELFRKIRNYIYERDCANKIKWEVA